jgi:hypothetical protein
MNERIQELDKAAQEYAGRMVGNDEDSNYNEWFNVYKAKFAELIIQEAGEAFWSEACHVSDLAYEEYYRNSKKIKRHFGVEL